VIHSNLKSDFFNKLNTYLTNNAKQQHQRPLRSNLVISNLRLINFSRNQIEDRGLTLLVNSLLNNQVSSIANVSFLREIHLSKCSLTSKSVNQMFASMTFDNSLTNLDLSHNSLRDDPVELFKFLSEPNHLIELNLTTTDLDMDKLFSSLSKGGCDLFLRKLAVSNNSAHQSSSSSKAIGSQNVIKFFLNTKSLSHVELSNCKLNSVFMQ
jgi:hypothetical protein